MISLDTFWRSTIGKKFVMAITGIMMIGFLITHMLVNLLVFDEAWKINAYAAFLKNTDELLWIARLVLLAAVLLHVIVVVQLTRLDYAARPQKYVHRLRPQGSTIASRTMRIGGLALLLFIPLHLLHFTTGTIQPAAFSPTNVYANLVGSFRIWWVTLLYSVAMVALASHVYHGAWASIRTLGLGRPSRKPLQHSASTYLALALLAGFTAVPVSIYLGWVR